MKNPIGFGKFSNYSIMNIYQGSIESCFNIVDYYLMDRWKKISPDFYPLSQNIFLMTAGISQIENSVISIEIDDMLNPIDYSKDIEILFNLERLINEKKYLDTPLNYYVQNSFDVVVDRIPDGNPNYIEWLILNHDYFNIKCQFLDLIEKLPVFTFTGINVKKNSDHEYLFFPKHNISFFKFSDSVREVSEKKGINFNYEIGEENEEENGFGFSDGYSGYIDDELIDDGLDGEPDAYWNID